MDSVSRPVSHTDPMISHLHDGRTPRATLRQWSLPIFRALLMPVELRVTSLKDRLLLLKASLGTRETHLLPERAEDHLTKSGHCRIAAQPVLGTRSILGDYAFGCTVVFVYKSLIHILHDTL